MKQNYKYKDVSRNKKTNQSSIGQEPMWGTIQKSCTIANGIRQSIIVGAIITFSFVF